MSLALRRNVVLRVPIDGFISRFLLRCPQRFVMTGYARGGLVMIWEIDTGKPWMKVIATPEKSVGDTQADRVRQAQRKAKQAARAAAEAKKRMRAKSNPSMARSGSDAFLPSQHTDGPQIPLRNVSTFGDG
jgi:hypothetical protein